MKPLASIAARNPEESTLNPFEFGEWLKNYSSLKHPRIAEFLGCALMGDKLAVISVWYPNGNIADFLTVAPHVQRKPMVSSLINDMALARS